MVAWIRFGILLALALVALFISVIAWADAQVRPDKAFTSEGKQSRKFWLILLGVGCLLAFLGVLLALEGTSAQFFLQLVPVIPGAIYWYSVRPHIRPYGLRKK